MDRECAWVYMNIKFTHIDRHIMITWYNGHTLWSLYHAVITFKSRMHRFLDLFKNDSIINWNFTFYIFSPLIYLLGFFTTCN